LGLSSHKVFRRNWIKNSQRTSRAADRQRRRLRFGNTFLCMRLANTADKNHVLALLPDSMQMLTSVLPSLPRGQVTPLAKHRRCRFDLRFHRLQKKTVLVGPQASGESIFLQFLQLLLDTGSVLNELRKNGLSWNRDIGKFLDIYLGEGMREIWKNGDKSEIRARFIPARFSPMLSLTGPRR